MDDYVSKPIRTEELCPRSSARPVPMPESLDPRALDEILTMAGGDREFVVAVVEQYLADSAGNCRRAALAGGRGLARAAHTLKSTSASVGACARRASARRSSAPRRRARSTRR